MDEIKLTVKGCKLGRANLRFASPWHVHHVTFEESTQTGLSDTPMLEGATYWVVFAGKNPVTRIHRKRRVTELNDGQTIAE